MTRRLCAFGIAMLLIVPGWAPTAMGQASSSEVEALRQEIQKLQERLNRLEQSQRAPVPAPAVQAPTPAPAAPPPTAQVALRPGEREIQLERSHPLEVIGLPKPEIGTLRLSGFFVGSFNYNSHIQMVPEFAGNAPASSEARRTDFRFDQFTIGASTSDATSTAASSAPCCSSPSTRFTAPSAWPSASGPTARSAAPPSSS